MRVVIVGGGILGLAAARQLAVARPGVDITLFEKEDELALHQTGHNSGVVHAGIYYRPGSRKAALCTRGRVLLEEFCARTGVRYDACGKVIVARDLDEQARLGTLRERAVANGVPDVHEVGPAGLADIEPHVRGRRALVSPHTAIADFREVALALAGEARSHGVDIRTSTAVTDLSPAGDGVAVATTRGVYRADTVLACGGLHADRIATAAAAPADPRIVPFRGEYQRLRPPVSRRIRALVYPVPDPRYPFLGVHFTRTVDGDVLVGPNAVLALAREGYRWSDVHLRDLRDTLAWPGFWRMARRHWRTGVREVAGSLSRRLTARAARTYLPGLRARDLEPAGSGVRAQAVDRRGALLDDFVIDRRGPVLHVRNAPSPAATSALAIAEHVVSELVGEPVQAPESAA